jgi:hypothetical protein
MNPIIPCPSVETLDWFLDKCPVALVCASVHAHPTVFLQLIDGLESTLQSLAPDLAIAPLEVLSMRLKRPPEHGELLIFRSNRLLERLTTSPDSLEERRRQLRRRKSDPGHPARHRAAQARDLARALGRAHGTAAEPNLKQSAARAVLGVGLEANAKEIEAARRERTRLYHPDRFTHLDACFQDLAQRKIRDLNDAARQLSARSASLRAR